MNQTGSQGLSSMPSIHSSNVGFQLLKKHGWKEGTGLGASEQGRLDPIEVIGNENKRGLGADKPAIFIGPRTKEEASEEQRETKKAKVMILENLWEGKPKKPSKRSRKRMWKLQQLEEESKEKEFRRAFFSLFLPDNV